MRRMVVFLAGLAFARALSAFPDAAPDADPGSADVDCASTFAPWIEELLVEGITGGGSVAPPRYCPDAPSARGQMAVFLEKTFIAP